MTEREIMQLDADGIENRVAQIAKEANASGADLTALNTEMDQIENRRAQIRQEAENRANLMRRVANGAGSVVRGFGGADDSQKEDRSYNAASPEYRSAWMKDMAVRSDNGRRTYLLGQMTDEEKRAFTQTTENTGAVVPTATMNRIIELVNLQAPMLADAEPSEMTQGFGVPRHKATKKGSAKGVAEGTANEDSEEEFDLLPLTGVEIKKHIVITRKMKFQSVDAFERWMTKNLADQIAVGKEKLILSRLKGEAPDGGSVVNEAGIDAGNKLTEQKYDDKTIRDIMGKLEPEGEVVIYANNKTIWGPLMGITDEDKKKIFIPDYTGANGVKGRIYGACVKQDQQLADDEVFFGIKGQVLANDYDALEIFSAIEPKTINTIETAYSLFDAALQNPKAFVHAKFTAPA